MDQLTISSRGLWSIETISGNTYLLDLDSRLVLREADRFATEHGTLRRDGNRIRLIQLLHCEVGEHMLLVVNLSVPDVLCTTRVSTTVLRIESVNPHALSL